MSSPSDMAIPVPVHFDGHNINIITEFPNTPTPAKISTSSNKDRQSLYKTELCREWSTSGWCYYGKRCSFAHGLNELRPVFRSKKWRTKRCRNWQGTGYCPYEHRCQFLHDQSPPRRLTDFEGTTVDVEAGDEVGSDSGDNNGPAGASGKNNSEHSGASTKRRQRQSTAGDAQGNSKDLYFHFEVQAQDDEEDESEAGESENEAGAMTVNNSSGRGNPNNNNGKKRGNNRSAMDNNDILNDIGNTHRVSSGEMDGEYGTAGAADTMFGEDNRKKRRPKRKKGDPVVKPIYFSGDSNNMTAPRRGGKNSNPTPGGKVAPLDGEPTVNPMQPHIVSGPSATAQLAAQLASMQLSNSTNPQDPSQQAYFPLFGGPANAANAHPPVVSPVAGQSPQQAAAIAAAMGILRQQSVTPTPTQNNQQGQSPPTTAMNNLPPLSSIPMDAATALLSTVYGFPQWPELYHAAQNGQLPQADLQHMTQVMQHYPGTLTAPVPFPATPVANTPAPGSATLVLDSMMGTPSASTEYNLYPTPSPPPSSLGVDSVSNIGPYQFVPQDSPAPFLPAYQPGLGAMPLGLDSTSMAHAATLDPTQFLLSLNHAPFSVPQSTDTPGPMPMFTATPQPGANTFGNVPPQGPLPGLAGAPSTSGRGPSPPSQFNNGVPGMYGGFFPTGIAGGMGGPPPPGLSVGNSAAAGAPFASSGDYGDPNIVLFAQNFGSGVINIDGQAHQASS